MRIALCILIFAAAGLLAWMSLFTVDPTEYVYVTQFGRHVATYDGSLNDEDAGLHGRWPWPVQSVRRLDRRLQHLDLPAIELLTRDTPGGDKGTGSSVDKTLTVEAYVCWRIAGKEKVDAFVRKIDTPDRARAILGQRVNGELGALIGQLRMDDLISTSLKVENTIEKLRSDLLNSLQAPVLAEYGIEIVDIRLKRFNHPANVRDTIFARIRSEREVKAAKYINDGKKQAEEIRTEANAKVLEMMQAAEKVERETKLAAEVDAEKIRMDAFAQDREFFSFWQQLEQMKSILGNSRTTLLLSTHRSLFDFLFNVPGEPRGNQMNPPAKKGD